MEPITALLAFAGEISIRHVLVLNLVGWIIKGCLNHKGWESWTDIIPVILALLGVGLAYFDEIIYPGHFIVYGLANAGLAWLLHRVAKETKKTIQKIRK